MPSVLRFVEALFGGPCVLPRFVVPWVIGDGLRVERECDGVVFLLGVRLPDRQGVHMKRCRFARPTRVIIWQSFNNCRVFFCSFVDLVLTRRFFFFCRSSISDSIVFFFLCFGLSFCLHAPCAYVGILWRGAEEGLSIVNNGELSRPFIYIRNLNTMKAAGGRIRASIYAAYAC